MLEVEHTKFSTIILNDTQTKENYLCLISIATWHYMEGCMVINANLYTFT